MFAPPTEASLLAVAEEPSVYAVTHPVVQARVVGARTVQLAVVAVEPGPTPTEVVRVGDVSADTVVLAGRRGAGVVAGAVATVEAIVAEAVVVPVGDQVPTVAPVLTRTGGDAPVDGIALVPDEPPSAFAALLSLLPDHTGAAVLATQEPDACAQMLAAIAEITLCACATSSSAFRDRCSAVMAFYFRDIVLRSTFLCASVLRFSAITANFFQGHVTVFVTPGTRASGTVFCVFCAVARVSGFK